MVLGPELNRAHAHHSVLLSGGAAGLCDLVLPKAKQGVARPLPAVRRLRPRSRRPVGTHKCHRGVSCAGLGHDRLVPDRAGVAAAAEQQRGGPRAVGPIDLAGPAAARVGRRRGRDRGHAAGRLAFSDFPRARLRRDQPQVGRRLLRGFPRLAGSQSLRGRQEQRGGC